MELNIPGIRAFFKPFDGPHLLRLWAILALVIILFALITAIIGVYPQARQFWKVHLVVLGATFLLSGVVFLLFHLDPLLLLLSLPCAAFIVQGDLGVDWKGPIVSDQMKGKLTRLLVRAFALSGLHRRQKVMEEEPEQ